MVGGLHRSRACVVPLLLALAVLLAVASAGGCARRAALVEQAKVEALAERLKAAEGLKSEVVLVPTGGGGNANGGDAGERWAPTARVFVERLELADERARDAADAGASLSATQLEVAQPAAGSSPAPRPAAGTIVFIHGVFADGVSWRFVTGDLAHDAERLLLIDLLGCGRSDAPDPDDLGPYGYSPSSQARRVLEALRATLPARASLAEQGSPAGGGPPPADVVLVGHSYGAAVVLRMWGDDRLRGQYADVLSRVDRVVLLSPVDLHVHAPDPRMARLARVNGFDIFFLQRTGLLRRIVEEQTVGSAPEGTEPLVEEAAKRLEFLTEPAKRRALQAMLMQIGTIGPDLRPDWRAVERVERGYARVTPPVLVLHGSRDEVTPLAGAYKLAGELPRARLVVMEGAAHSPQIERPEETVLWLRRFIDGGLDALPSRARGWE